MHHNPRAHKLNLRHVRPHAISNTEVIGIIQVNWGF